MRNPFVIVCKLIMKGVALIALSALKIFSCLFGVFFFCYRMVAVVFAAIGFFMIAVECYKHGINMERALISVALVAAVAMCYVFPLLMNAMQYWAEDLEYYILEPLFVKPPVRYTI